MPNAFSYQTTIKFHEVDAAGRLFFAHQLRIAHDAYEAFLESAGLPIAEIIRDRSYDLPLIHAESDYLAPVFVGDNIRVHLLVDRIGASSFTLAYQFFNDQQLVGRAKTVHVAVDSGTGKKIALPEEIMEKLR